MPDEHGTSTWNEIGRRIGSSVDGALHPGARRYGELTATITALSLCQAHQEVGDVARELYANAVQDHGKHVVDLLLRRAGVEPVSATRASIVTRGEIRRSASKRS